MEIIGSKAPGNYSGPFWTSLFDLLMGEPKFFYFYDFRILRRVSEPLNKYHLAFETPWYLKKTQEIPWNIFKSCFCKSQNCGHPPFCQMTKRRAPTNLSDPSNKSWKSWIWDQYHLENMKWKCGNLFEIKKPRNQKTRFLLFPKQRRHVKVGVLTFLV